MSVFSGEPTVSLVSLSVFEYTMFEKPASVATCTSYSTPCTAAVHSSIGAIAVLIAPSAGEVSELAPGTDVVTLSPTLMFLTSGVIESVPVTLMTYEPGAAAPVLPIVMTLLFPGVTGSTLNPTVVPAGLPVAARSIELLKPRIEPMSRLYWASSGTQTSTLVGSADIVKPGSSAQL